MAAQFATSTPSPPPRVRTPQTPKHGYSDHWEPFSPRKSARISSQRERANRTRTPSPKPSASRNASSKPANNTFGSPAVSPQKKRAPAMDSVRRAPRLPGVARAAESLGLAPTSQPTSAPRASGMLPTPVKTPSDRKKRDEKIEAGVRAAARNLFHDDSDGLSSPRKKKSKKYTGLSLDSFNAEVVDEPIQIFTDSRDRLPEVDASVENPFYGETATTTTTQQAPTRRSPRRKMVIVPGEGKIPMEEAVRREDGIVYVFRGKTFWKPNGLGNAADQLDVDGELSGDILDTLADDLEPRRVTRSAIKPRLLFARERKAKEVVVDHNTEDEEAATDIEEHALPSIVVDSEEPAVETPVEDKDTPDTPTAPRFAPASPPSTTRATRTTKKPESPLKKPTKSRSSPFDSWRRSKASGSRGQKREAEPLPANAPKRQRA